MAIDYSNQFSYLKKLTQNGSKGKSAWAQQQANKYGMDLSQNGYQEKKPITTAKPDPYQSVRPYMNQLDGIAKNTDFNFNDWNNLDAVKKQYESAATAVSELANKNNITKSQIDPLYQYYLKTGVQAHQLGFQGEIAPGYITGFNNTNDPRYKDFVSPESRGFDPYSPTDYSSVNNNVSTAGTGTINAFNQSVSNSPTTSYNPSADQYYQQILDAKKNYNRDPKKYTKESNAARDALKQMGIDTSSGSWASGNDYRTADQQYLTDKYQQQNNSMYDNLQSSQLGALHASQQQATNQLNQQKAEYGQQIHAQQGQADVTSMQNVQKLREIMSSNGINSSGENISANVGLQSARQGALNGLDQQMNNYSRDIGNQISAINDPSKEQSIIASLQAQRAQALMNAQQTAYNQASQEANTNWDHSFQQSQADQSQANYQSEQARRAYEYSHMSAYEKANMDQAASQFGENMAWQMWDANKTAASQQAMLQAQLGAFPKDSGGGDYTNYKMMPQAQKSPNYNKFTSDLTSAIKKTGVPESWYTPLAELVGRESSWNPNAKNPSSSAKGYGQFLTSTIKNYSKYGNYNNPVDQLVMMMHYIKDRYGTPQDALTFWDKNKYY